MVKCKEGWVVLTLRMPEEMRSVVKALAALQNKSMEELVREILQEALERAQIKVVNPPAKHGGRL